MGNYELIEELCSVARLQADIIQKQAEAIAQAEIAESVAADLAEKRKSGGKYKNFYLLEETEDNELLALSFKGTKENAAGVSLYLSSFLSKNGIEESRANRIAVAVEEMAASCAERMEGKKKFADIDIRIFADKKETIISVRDNGDEFDPLNDDKEFEMSSLTVVKAISDKVEYSRVLGFNRTIIKL